MNSMKAIGTITILLESTDKKLCTQKKVNVTTAEIRSTLENISPQSVPRKHSMHLDIGQINLHLSNVNKTLLKLNSSDADISDVDILNNVRKLGQICNELGKCCSNMEGVILKRINCNN